MPYPVTMFYGSLLGLVLLALSWVVSKHRLRAKISLGDGGDERLYAAIRAHANFVEYALFGLFLLLLAEMSGAGALLLHALGLALLLGRAAHAWGIQRPSAVNPYRKWGTALTWVMILVTALYNLVYLALGALSG